MPSLLALEAVFVIVFGPKGIVPSITALQERFQVARDSWLSFQIRSGKGGSAGQKEMSVG